MTKTHHPLCSLKYDKQQCDKIQMFTQMPTAVHAEIAHDRLAQSLCLLSSWLAARLKRKRQQELCDWQDSDSADQILGCMGLEHHCGCLAKLKYWVYLWKAVFHFAPHCCWWDRPRWGKRLIEGLACIRMWLLTGVREKSFTLALSSSSVCLPPQSICLLPAPYLHCS